MSQTNITSERFDEILGINRDNISPKVSNPADEQTAPSNEQLPNDAERLVFVPKQAPGLTATPEDFNPEVPTDAKSSQNASAKPQKPNLDIGIENDSASINPSEVIPRELDNKDSGQVVVDNELEVQEEPGSREDENIKVTDIATIDSNGIPKEEQTHELEKNTPFDSALPPSNGERVAEAMAGGYPKPPVTGADKELGGLNESTKQTPAPVIVDSADQFEEKGTPPAEEKNTNDSNLLPFERPDKLASDGFSDPALSPDVVDADSPDNSLQILDSNIETGALPGVVSEKTPDIDIPNIEKETVKPSAEAVDTALDVVQPETAAEQAANTLAQEVAASAQKPGAQPTTKQPEVREVKSMWDWLPWAKRGRKDKVASQSVERTIKVVANEKNPDASRFWAAQNDGSEKEGMDQAA